MGRKPNQLIGEFFERGSKLEDSSNRYQHRCRACDELFPKGRLESMINHVLKKCPAVTGQDRERALNQLADTPNQHGSPNHLAVQMRRERQSGGPVTQWLPAKNNNMSPLETLAEVSRQRLDPHSDYTPHAATNDKKRKRTVGEVQQPAPEDNHANMFAEENQPPPVPSDNLVDDEHAQLVAGLNRFNAEQQRLEANQAVPNPFQQASVPMAQMLPSEQQQLAMAASAASEMIPRASLPLITPQLPKPQRKPKKKPAKSGEDQAIDPALQDGVSRNADSILGEQQLHDAVLQHAPTLQSQQPQIDFQSQGQPHKPKPRSRFTETRRKEVQTIRKQGACIRCRMLKKSCSDETPCATCRNVDSARLWKQPCIRARIADEFDLYAAGLYHTLEFFEVETAKAAANANKASNNVRATHFSTGQECAILFNSLRGQSTANGLPIHPELAIDESQNINPTEFVVIETDEDSEVQAKVEQYVHQSKQRFFEDQTSSLTRPTLLLATQLARDRVDPLLSRALDLWTATHILVDKAGEWQLSVTSAPPSPAFSPDQKPILQTEHTKLHRLVSLQISSVTERLAAQSCRALMNDLERRLLNRQQASSQSFETFLTSVVLLNCFEKMCWLYQGWIASPVHVLNSTGQYETGSWPLDKPPESFIAKADQIARIIAMLVKLRGVEPKYNVGEDNILRFRDPNRGEHDARAPHELDLDVVAKWFNDVRLSIDAMKIARDTAGTGRDNSGSWELKFISYLFLDEGSAETENQGAPMFFDNHKDR